MGLAVIGQAGCATGDTSDETVIGDEDGGGVVPDGAVLHDAHAADATKPSDGSASPDGAPINDVDSAVPEDDAGEDAASGDDGATQPPGDAGVDSAPPPVDAGVDSAPPPPVDAGVDSGTVNCSPVSQTGCPNGDKCTLTGSTPPATTCDPNGTVGAGGTCSGNPDNCAGPGICVGQGGGSPDTCHDFCSTDANCPAGSVPSGSTSEPKNTSHCILTLTGSSYDLCTVPCNPVTAAGASDCASGLACIYSGTSSIPEYTDCEAPGTVAEGNDCSSASCAAGLTCVSDSFGDYTCWQICRSGKKSDCTIENQSGGDPSCVSPSGVSNPMFGFCCPFGEC